LTIGVAKKDMIIFSARELKLIDKHTLDFECISSIELVVRAGTELAKSFMMHYPRGCTVACIAGVGNNGADALVMSHQLLCKGYDIDILVLKGKQSDDNQRLRDAIVASGFSHRIRDFSTIEHEAACLKSVDVIIDGLFGTGLNRKLEGTDRLLVDQINALGKEVVSIDIPSGMFCEDNSAHDLSGCVVARRTYAVQFPKLCYVTDETIPMIGELHFVDIQLKVPDNLLSSAHYFMTETRDIHLRRRERTRHKNDFGHVLVVGGSQGKVGASVMTTRAALRTGAGLATACVPSCGVPTMHAVVPEAMVLQCGDSILCGEIPALDRYSVVALGPGMGTANETRAFFDTLLDQTHKPMVVDADGLNILASNHSWISRLPGGSIITPHMREFERLVGPCAGSSERFMAMRELSIRHKIYIVLKGYRTALSTPEGDIYFNTTGNPGMATAGSGDVLTGIIAGFLAQGYPPLEAARTAVFLHGLAGDEAAACLTELCLMATDLIEYLPVAIKKQYNHQNQSVTIKKQD
jgi:NAD(P)H-hydrate epimerase